MTIGLGLGLRLGWSRGSAGTALSASTITRTTGATTYPPQVDFTRPIDWIDGNKATMQWSTDPLFGSGVTQGNTVTLAAATSSYDFGLSAIVSGSYFMRLGAWSGASQPSNGGMNWSNTINVGDTVAPTISTSTSQSGTYGVAGSVTLTASEVSTWAITGGADAASFTIAAGPASTALLSWTAFTATAAVQVTATDIAGNASAAWSGSVAITDPNQQWTSTVGANRNANMTLSGAHTEIATQAAAWSGVRGKTAIVPDKYHLEFTVVAVPSSSQEIIVGIDNATQSFASALSGSISFTRDMPGSNCVGLEDGGSGWNTSINCKDLSFFSDVSATAGSAWQVNDVVAIEGTRSTGEFKVFRVRSGTTTALYSGTLKTFTTCYPIFANSNSAGAVSLNTGQAAFAMAPTSGYSAANGS